VTSPGDLTSANWTTAGIHRLKASFARFDQNGDGNITPAELAERLEIFCWPCPVGEYYLETTSMVLEN